MIKKENNKKLEGHGLQVVILSDEAGIFDAYNFLKEKLSCNKNFFLSLIYSVSENNINPLFEHELCILEKRFPVNLIVHVLWNGSSECLALQVLIEATINSNTSPAIKFSIFGTEEFVNYIAEHLMILDIDTQLIETSIIN